SARYFGLPFDGAAARDALDAACAALPAGVRHRLRLALGHAGGFTTRSAPLTPITEPVALLMAQDGMLADDVFARHKTSIRSRYDAAWQDAERHGAFDALFFNERGELTEGGRSNVFVRIGGRWYTPPLSCGVLPGIMRAVLLAAPAWNASERVITRDMLDDIEDVMVCNALRGPLRAFLLE
ncbi:MAG: aminotransferase class IV, partial [Telluria sp.]